MLNVLIGSPIRQKPAILNEFLLSLEQVEVGHVRCSYCFFDENDMAESKKLLRKFSEIKKVEIIDEEKDLTESYVCDQTTHHWKEKNIWRVADIKNQILNRAREGDFDYLFLIDSDLIIHPQTLSRLIQCDKEIVSNIFWTSWQPHLIPLPQVWVSDQYTLFEKAPLEQLSEKELLCRQNAFLNRLKRPGTYEVGGLGACTLISRSALNKQISFQKIPNLSFWGEDRHFCVRAASMGCQLFVDTHYPSFHIYRESDLGGVREYQKRCKQTRITLSIVIRNEADRYLRRVLTQAKKYVSNVLIIDDASTDSSVALCEEILVGIPYKIIRNQVSSFSNEVELRSQQWEETIRMQPDWIMILDADELFEEKAIEELPKLAKDPSKDSYFFRLYDMWSETHYRSDDHWCAHFTYRPFMIRYDSTAQIRWNQKPQHCGRFPLLQLKHPGYSPLRIQHLGWSSLHDRKEKAKRYKQMDPEGKYGSISQYVSILDSNPSLVQWEENESIR